MSDGNSGTVHPGLNLGRRHPHAHRQAETEVFGFWIFMMSDLLVFGLLIATYVTMLGATAGGPGPAELFDLRSAFAQTMLLLASSATFGMATLSMKYAVRTRPTVLWLLAALALALAFLALEGRDLAAMIAGGAVPSRSGFLSAFWALVPLHGLHVACAALWLVALLGQIAVHGLDDPARTALLRLGVLWHFLDVVWVGIVSVVYLGGLA